MSIKSETKTKKLGVTGWKVGQTWHRNDCSHAKKYNKNIETLAGQPGVARAFALRAELCSSFSLRDHSTQRWTVHQWERLLFFEMCWFCRRVFIYSLPPCFFSAVFSECQIAAPYCFSCAPAVSSYLRRRRKRKILSLIRYIYVSGLLSVSTPPSKGAVPVIRPTQMLFPRQFTERKARRLWNTRSCYSPLWLLRVTGNCFWFLDLPPVWKGLVCSPSLHLLLVLFLVVRRLPLHLL